LHDDEDPCELHFCDYASVAGRQLPGRIEVRFGGEPYGVLAALEYELAPSKEEPLP
jgi:hypothetical protein